MPDWLASAAFWISLGTPVILAFLFVYLLARYWENSSKKKPEPTELHAESFRNPINSGITVTGIVIPLVVTLMIYLFKSHGQSLTDLAILLASLVILCLSISVGLYNNYSLATITTKDGVLEVSKDKNTYLPAVFVAQFLFLIFGLILLVVFLLVGLGPYKTAKSKHRTHSAYPLVKPPMRVKLSRDYLEKTWGTPDSKNIQGNSFEYIYHTPSSEITITITGDKITQVTETAKP